MAKKKHQSFLKAIKPVIEDNRVLYAMLGALSAGLGLGLVLGTEKGQDLVDKFTTAINGLGKYKGGHKKKHKKVKLAKPVKPVKPNKLARLAAIENS